MHKQMSLLSQLYQIFHRARNYLRRKTFKIVYKKILFKEVVQYLTFFADRHHNLILSLLLCDFCWSDKFTFNMHFRLSLLFAFMAFFAFALSEPTTSFGFNSGSIQSLNERGSSFSKPKPQVKPYTGPGALDTKGGGGGTNNPEIKAYYPTGNPNPETPLDANKFNQHRNTNTAGKEDDYFGNWGAFSKPSNRKREFAYSGYPAWL